MQGIERRRELLAWLEQRGCLTLAEMAARFGVSKMTLHRDLAALEKRQALKRIHGGAVFGEKAGARVPASGSSPQDRNDCLICQRPVGQHLHYSLTALGGKLQRYCCAHCGVSAQLASPEAWSMALATDFLTGRPHPAQQSWFVLGSVVAPCCRPSMLTFEEEIMAKRFQTGFGGQLGRLPQALEYLQEEMSLTPKQMGCPHCAEAQRK